MENAANVANAEKDAKPDAQSRNPSGKSIASESLRHTLEVMQSQIDYLYKRASCAEDRLDALERDPKETYHRLRNIEQLVTKIDDRVGYHFPR
jgi:hypothetical protein